MGEMQLAVAAALTGDRERRAAGLAMAAERLERAYRWLEAHLAGKMWAGGAAFILADWRTRSPIPIRRCVPIARACWRARPSPGRWRRRAPFGIFFRLARRTGIDGAGPSRMIRRAGQSICRGAGPGWAHSGWRWPLPGPIGQWPAPRSRHVAKRARGDRSRIRHVRNVGWCGHHGSGARNLVQKGAVWQPCPSMSKMAATLKA